MNSRSSGHGRDSESEQNSVNSFSLNGERPLKCFEESEFRVVHAPGFSVDHVRVESTFFEIYTGYKIAPESESQLDRLKSSFLEYESSSLARSPHNFLRVSGNTSKFDVEIDALGGRSCFFRIYDSQLFLCSEFEPLSSFGKDQLTVDRRAIEHFLSFGFTFAEETFFSEIRNIEPGYSYRFEKCKESGWRVSRTRVEYVKATVSTMGFEEASGYIIELLARAMNQLVEDFEVDQLGLSGGADSRLSMALLTDTNRQRITFKTGEFQPPSKRSFYDLKVAKLLAEKFNLNHKIYTDQFHGGSFESFLARYPLRKKPKLGGVYGGEFLGGESLGVLPFKRTDFTRQIVADLLSLVKSDHRSHFSFEDYQKWALSLPTPSKEFLSSVLTFRNAYFSSIYEGDLHWNSPSMIPQKVFSIFNLGEVLWELVHLPFEFIVDYRLYIELYKHLPSDYTEIPFDAAMVRKPSRPFKDAELEFDLSDVELRSPESTHHISVEDLFGDASFVASLEGSRLLDIQNISSFREKFDIEYHRRVALIHLWEKHIFEAN